MAAVGILELFLDDGFEPQDAFGQVMERGVAAIGEFRVARDDADHAEDRFERPFEFVERRDICATVSHARQDVARFVVRFLDQRPTTFLSS